MGPHYAERGQCLRHPLWDYPARQHWENSQWMSGTLTSFGIMGPQSRAALTPLNTTMLCDVRRDSERLSISPPWCRQNCESGNTVEMETSFSQCQAADLLINREYTRVPPRRRLISTKHTKRNLWDIFLLMIKCLFILNCGHVSSFRDSSVQSKVFKKCH